MKRTAFVILIFISIIITVFCIPVNSFANSSSIKFENFDMNSGLSAMSISSIIQDNDGYLWLGTSNGLNRFDGNEFVSYRYDRDDRYTLSGNGINVLYEDSNNNIWVGTNTTGLNKFNKNTGKSVRYQHDRNDSESLSNDSVWAICEDKEHNIWVATDGGGLNKLRPGSDKFIHYTNDLNDKNSLCSDSVYAMIEDKYGELWIGTIDRGLSRFDPGTETFTQYKHNPNDDSSIASNSVWAIYEDSKGEIWLGTAMGGLNKFDRENNSFIRYKHDIENKNSISNDIINDICEDKDGMLWIGTFGGGLNKFDPETEKFVTYSHNPSIEYSLSNDVILSVFVDREGTVWAGTDSGGLDKHNHRTDRIRHYTSIPTDTKSLSNKDVTAIMKDSRGILWVGTGNGGLNRMDKDSDIFIHYKNNSEDAGSLSNNIVKSIYEDSYGNVWTATWGGGLNIFNLESETFTNLYISPINDSNNYLRTIYEDKKKNLWVGSEGGLSRYDYSKGTFETFSNNPEDPFSLSHNSVNSIFEDSCGNLWIGTRSGLNILDRETMKFTSFKYNLDDSHSLSSNIINSLYEDSESTLWIGTNEGINKYNRKTGDFSYYGLKDGLSSSYVYGILEDGEGYLWISTDKGLSRFDSKNEIFVNFDENYGLQNNLFNINSCFKSETGEMYFGGINGFDIFDPSNIKPNEYIPNVKITKIETPERVIYTNQLMDSEREMYISYKENKIVFEFMSDSLVMPEKNQFAYMLEGFDDEWIYCGNEKTATYTSINGGNYTFRVKGSNNDGVWNETSASLKINISIPPWQSWWAFLIYFAILCCLVALFIRAMFNKSKKKIEDQKKVIEKLEQFDSLKDEIMANISHELRTPIYGIIGISESMLDGAAGEVNDIQRYNLSLLSSSSRRLSNLVNDLLVYSRLKNSDIKLYYKKVDLHQLTQQVIDIIKHSINSNKIIIKNSISHDFPLVLADEERLTQIMYNLIENAVKYTPEGSVEVFAIKSDSYIKVGVKDTGIGIDGKEIEYIFDTFRQAGGGFSRNHAGAGLGLSIVKQLVELHGGEINATSSPGEGSNFYFTIPIKSDVEIDSDFAPSSSVISGFMVNNAEKSVESVFSNNSTKSDTKILIADDEKINRQILFNFFSLSGYSVTAVSNGYEVLEELDSNSRYDLVILDVMMPKMSGYDVCKSIR